MLLIKSKRYHSVKHKRRDEHVKYVIDMEQTRIRRWNLIGYIISIIVTIALIGLIIYGKEHIDQLEVVMYVTVILIVAVFAIIRRNIKIMCNNKLNHKS